MGVILPPGVDEGWGLTISSLPRGEGKGGPTEPASHRFARYTGIATLRRTVFLLAMAALLGGLFSLPPALGAEASGKPSPSSTAPGNPTPKPSNGKAAPSLPPPGTLPVGSTRTNPPPSSPTAPALITVDPSTIDPGVDNALNIFGRNLSPQTLVQVDTVNTVPAAVIDVPDAWHLIVSLPKGSLHDGTHDIVLFNPDGQLDDAMGVLTAHSPGLPILVYIVAGGLVCAFVAFRVGRWLLR